MGRKAPKFGRKPQVQLDGGTPKPPTFGLGYQPSEGSSAAAGGDVPGPVLGGGGAGGGGGFSLLASYGDSDSEEEQGGPTPTQKPTKPIAFQRQTFIKADVLEPMRTASPVVNSPARDSPAPPEPAQEKPLQDENKTPEMTEDDMKLKAFLSEIDAMEPGESSPAPVTTDNDLQDEEEEAEEKPPAEPTAPTTGWQHCLDEGTQHYYYWNVLTNAVTWEIPPDYSQYLLQVNEHELQKAKYEREHTAWEERDKQRMQRNQEKRDRKAKRLEEMAVKRKAFTEAKKQAAAAAAAAAAAVVTPESEADGVSLPASPVHNAAETEGKPEPEETSAEATTASQDSQERVGIEEEEDVTMDMDELDHQLDMALEKTKTELSEKPDNKPQSGKRKASPSPLPNSPSKKPKQEDLMSGVAVQRLQMADVQEKMADMERVVDLCDLLADKLQFLGASPCGLTTPQILCIELQTRLSDWRAGGLSNSRLLAMLQAGLDQLALYESTVAAPQGWACHWHREYKRYFYCNEVSGESCWDFPEEEVVQEQPASETTNQPLQEEQQHGPQEEQPAVETNHAHQEEQHHPLEEQPALGISHPGEEEQVNGAEEEKETIEAHVDEVTETKMNIDGDTKESKITVAKESKPMALVMNYMSDSNDESGDEDSVPVEVLPAKIEMKAEEEVEDVQDSLGVVEAIFEETAVIPAAPSTPPTFPPAPFDEAPLQAPSDVAPPQPPAAAVSPPPPPTVATPPAVSPGLFASEPPPPPPTPPPPAPPTSAVQDLLQVVLAAPPPPPPPLEQEAPVVGVNFAHLAHAPPPPPPPPQELEQGELPASSGEEEEPQPQPVSAPFIESKTEAMIVPDIEAAPTQPIELIGAPVKIENGGSDVRPSSSPTPPSPPVPAPVPASSGTSSSSSSHHSSRHSERKKRKKDKGLKSDKLSMKKKRVPSLVEKWQNVQKEVNAAAEAAASEGNDEDNDNKGE